MLDVVILAAGKGTRMRSDKPKVLHTLAGKSFLQHVVDRAQEIHARNIFVVVGHGAEEVKSEIADPNITFVDQHEQLGTGHAVQQVLPYLEDDAAVLILYGDVPLIARDTLAKLAAKASLQSMGLLTVELMAPHGYGRILRDDIGRVIGVVEQKDADELQQKIREVNTGVMAVRSADLRRWLPQLSDDNAQGEFLLPDIIAMAHDEEMLIDSAQPSSPSEVLGVNNRLQQSQLERLFQQQIAEKLLEEGISLADSQRFDCRGSLHAGRDCVIDINCVFEGEVTLGNNVSIGPNCHIIDAHIGDNVEIKSHTVIEGARIEDDVIVGPFARLRPGTYLYSEAKVGNFVEIKKAVIGEGSKVNHLSYVGDAEVGANVNIGAGTITCNYDGANKHITKIEDGVFVGSNTALVAPVTLGENVTVAAGSIITKDVEKDSLVVARARQRSVEDWQRPIKQPK